MRIHAGSKPTTSAVLAALALTLSLAHAQEADDARAVVLVAAETAPLMAQDTPERRWALLIGVDAYTSEVIRDLRYAGNDVRAVAAQLVESGSWRADHIVVMTSDADRPELLPTRSNIYDKILWLRSLSDAHTVLFYFSGHGVGHQSRGEKTNYLLPSDVKVDPRLGPVEALDEDEMVNLLEGVDAAQRLVVLDACRNQPTVEPSRDLVAPSAVSSLHLAEGTQILRATKFGQVSLERDDCAMGAFTCELVKGLSGTADGFGGAARDGLVTVTELFGFVREEMQVAGQHGNTQIPELDGPHTGDFVVVRWPGPVEVSTGPVPPPPRVDAPFGVVRVSGDASRVRVVRADGAESLSGSPLAPGTYTLRATFDGFQEGPAGTVEVLPGEEASVRCDARFVSCDVERYDRRAGE